MKTWSRRVVCRAPSCGQTIITRNIQRTVKDTSDSRLGLSLRLTLVSTGQVQISRRQVWDTQHGRTLSRFWLPRCFWKRLLTKPISHESGTHQQVRYPRLCWSGVHAGAVVRDDIYDCNTCPWSFCKQVNLKDSQSDIILFLRQRLMVRTCVPRIFVGTISAKDCKTANSKYDMASLRWIA